MNQTRLLARLPLLALTVLGAALALAVLQRGLASAAPSAAGVTVVPANATQAAAPGGVVTYTLWVTNTGDATDIFTLTVTGQAWLTDIFVMPATIIVPNTQVLIELTPGEGRLIHVRVTLPLDATGQDVTTFTAVSTNDPVATDNAILTTTTGGRLFLPLIMKQ